MSEQDKYTAVRLALRQDSPLWQVQHIDITCDGCEVEPIVGHRFKCTVCEDIDLCGSCMRALVAARIKMSQEAPAAGSAPARQGRRPRKWVSKLHSRDLAEKWAALQTAVPCLHPSHKFLRVLDGPERAVVFLAGQHASSTSGNSGGSSSSGAGGGASVGGTANEGQQQQPEHQAAAVAEQGRHSDAAAGAAVGAAAGPDGSSSGSSDALEKFLATFRPSAASCRDVAWIVVSHPDADEQAQQQAPQQQQQQPSEQASSQQQQHGGSSLEERVDAAVEEWEQLTAAAASAGRRVTAADVDALAAKHGILKGKWMLFARSAAEADAAWAAVARAVCGQQQQQQQQQGSSGGGGGSSGSGGSSRQWLCGSAKVSSTGPEADGSWVLCCYTDNYQDAADVQRVCRGLQAAIPPGLLQDRRLLYKPDVFTYLGIYSRNEWQLKPTVAEARLS